MLKSSLVGVDGRSEINLVGMSLTLHVVVECYCFGKLCGAELGGFELLRFGIASLPEEGGGLGELPSLHESLGSDGEILTGECCLDDIKNSRGGALGVPGIIPHQFLVARVGKGFSLRFGLRSFFRLGLDEFMEGCFNVH